MARAERADESSVSFGIEAVLASLSDELRSAQETAKDRELYGMHISEVEVELTVGVAHKTSGKGGVELFVVRTDASYEQARERTHVVRIKLAPSGVSGKQSVWNEAVGVYPDILTEATDGRRVQRYYTGPVTFAQGRFPIVLHEVDLPPDSPGGVPATPPDL